MVNKITRGRTADEPKKAPAPADAKPPKVTRGKTEDSGDVAKLTPKKGAKSDEGAEDEEKDYLLKYQYGRELPLGDPRSNPTGGKSLHMKNMLLAQPRVRVLIPVDSGSDASVPFSVNLNGYRLDLPRNTYIDVPEGVADVIMNSHNQTERAVNQMRIGRDKGTAEALS